MPHLYIDTDCKYLKIDNRNYLFSCVKFLKFNYINNVLTLYNFYNNKILASSDIDNWLIEKGNEKITPFLDKTQILTQVLELISDCCNNCLDVCEPPSGSIIGISNVFTVDGWYLQFNAQNLVYMESGVIVGDPVPCASGVANYFHPDGDVMSNGLAGPHMFYEGSWQNMMITKFEENNDGISLDASYWTNMDIMDPTSITLEHKNTPDAGWHIEETSTEHEGLFTMPYTTSLTIRINLLVNGCNYYNPDVLGDLVCKQRKPEDFQYQVPSADPPGVEWVIYPIALIPPGLTPSIQGSTDTGSTWFDIATNVDPAAIDGLTPYPTGSTSIRTRLRFTDIWGCVYFSKENRNTE